MKFLDDDTHVYNGNAFQRYLKMRKWLLLTAAFLWSMHQSWYQHDVLNDFIPIWDVPEHAVQTGIIVLGGYLFIQASLLLVQIRATYKEDLNKRSQTVPREMHDKTMNELKELLKEREGSEKFISLVMEVLENEKTEPRKIAEKIQDVAEQLYSREHSVRMSELAIDFMRIVPTMLFMGISLVCSIAC